MLRWSPKRLEAERARLRKIAGLETPEHFHRPIERAFTAEQRNQVTILFGGFTETEDLIALSSRMRLPL
jgi:hypothetical protein